VKEGHDGVKGEEGGSLGGFMHQSRGETGGRVGAWTCDEER
jgi:hypothetical protein